MKKYYDIVVFWIKDFLKVVWTYRVSIIVNAIIAVWLFDNYLQLTGVSYYVLKYAYIVISSIIGTHLTILYNNRKKKNI
jgi:hypothetical protein